MSILVKGMKMPKDCPQCLLSSWSPITNEFLGCFAVPGKRYAMLDKEYAKSSERPDWCPLVELSEKHGRLIEEKEIRTVMNWLLTQPHRPTWNDLYHAIQEMEAIIEAEREEK